MPTTKSFSNSEIELVINKDFIDQKNKIQQRVFSLLNDLGNQTSIKHNAHFSSISPKVSKGENLENYPFMILDYPRHFSKKEIFVFRTLFWWGNYICFIVHLKGMYIPKNLDQLKSIITDYPHQLYLSNSGNEWNHNVYSSNYTQLSNSRIFGQEQPDLPFLKICQTLALEDLNTLEEKYQIFLDQLIVPLWHGRK